MSAAKALLLTSLLALALPGPARACDRSAAGGLLAQAREPGAQLVLGSAGRPGWIEVGGTPRAVRLLGPPECRGPGWTTGPVLATLHAGSELRQGLASLRPLTGSPGRPLVQALERWQAARTVEAEVQALLTLLSLDPVVASEAGVRLLELAVEQRLPEALVAELGRRARRLGLQRAELSAYLEVGRSLKPDWYDDTVIWHLARGNPEILALVGEHTLACWEERVVITVLGRLRDRDPAARAAATAILHDRTGQRFSQVTQWETWLRRNLAHRRLP